MPRTDASSPHATLFVIAKALKATEAISEIASGFALAMTYRAACRLRGLLKKAIKIGYISVYFFLLFRKKTLDTAGELC